MADLKRKKKTRLWISVLAAAGGALIGQAAGSRLAGSDQIATVSATTIFKSDSDTTSQIGDDNPEYTKIFSDRFIVAMPMFVIGQDVSSFAKVVDDGTVDRLEFAYKDDVISVFSQTIYIDITNVPEDQREALDAEAKGMFAEYEGMDFLTFDYNLGATYYRVSYTMEDLNDPEVYAYAKEAGMLEVDGDADWMSMEATESNLLEQGYIKR